MSVGGLAASLLGQDGQQLRSAVRNKIPERYLYLRPVCLARTASSSKIIKFCT